jgi:hypothetical protein
MVSSLKQQVNLSRRACGNSFKNDDATSTDAVAVAKPSNLLDIVIVVKPICKHTNGATSHSECANLHSKMDDGLSRKCSNGLVNENNSQFNNSENIVNNLNHNNYDENSSNLFESLPTCKTNFLRNCFVRWKCGGSVRRSMMYILVWFVIVVLSNNGMVTARPNLSTTSERESSVSILILIIRISYP